MMCCNNGATRSSAMQASSSGVIFLPSPTGGLTPLSIRPPQPLPPVITRAKPFPWAWILAGVVAFVLIVPKAR